GEAMSVLFDAPGPRAIRRHRIIGAITIVVLVTAAALVLWKLWVEDQFTAQKWEPFVTPDIMLLILEGLGDTAMTAAFAIVGALIVGVFFGVAKLSDHKIVSVPSWIFVEFFRAVP